MSPLTTLERLSLGIAAAGFGVFGTVLLVHPALLELVGVSAHTSAGTTELRAFYGGLELGLAAFFVLALRRPSWVRAALTVQVAAAGGIVLARVLAVLVAGGGGNVLIWLSGLGEGAVALVGVLALRRGRVAGHG